MRQFCNRLSGVYFTPEGGIAQMFVNKTGAPSVKGTVIDCAGAVAKGVAKIAQGIPDAIGAIYEDGIADGSEVLVVTSGVADVLFIGNTTIGQLARGFVAADAGFIAGYALAENVPSPPFTSDKHFYEIGHVLETRIGAGLAKVNMHFN